MMTFLGMVLDIGAAASISCISGTAQLGVNLAATDCVPAPDLMFTDAELAERQRSAFVTTSNTTGIAGSVRLLPNQKLTLGPEPMELADRREKGQRLTARRLREQYACL
jgi:hypothetical protein